LEQARGLLSHRLPPQAGLADVVRSLAEIGIQTVQKQRFGLGATEKTAKKMEESETSDQNTSNICADAHEVPTPQESALNSNPPVSRHIPMAVRRRVFERAKGRCEFIGSDGHRCEARTFLEFDHAHLPFAKGGDHSELNLILACYHHNKHRAMSDFGTWVNHYSRHKF
jgi:hypothetical protein